MTTNLSEDYIIRLGKYLEYKKVEREAQNLEKAREEVRRLAAASKRLKAQKNSEKERSQELKDIKYHLDGLRYARENPDPPKYLPDGRAWVTVWKAPPEEH